MIYTLLSFLILMFVLNFAFIRPHRKAFNKRAIMLNSIRTGLVVYTADGVRAKVEAVKRDVVTLSCYPDGVRLFVDLESIERVENYDEKHARSLMDAKIQKGREALANRRISRQKEEAETKKEIEKIEKSQDNNKQGE